MGKQRTEGTGRCSEVGKGIKERDIRERYFPTSLKSGRPSIGVNLISDSDADRRSLTSDFPL